jgi:hypothetical protein
MWQGYVNGLNGLAIYALTSTTSIVGYFFFYSDTNHIVINVVAISTIHAWFPPKVGFVGTTVVFDT